MDNPFEETARESGNKAVEVLKRKKGGYSYRPSNRNEFGGHRPGKPNAIKRFKDMFGEETYERIRQSK
jgi:hypothetical protein